MNVKHITRSSSFAPDRLYWCDSGHCARADGGCRHAAVEWGGGYMWRISPGSYGPIQLCWDLSLFGADRLYGAVKVHWRLHPRPLSRGGLIDSSFLFQIFSALFSSLFLPFRKAEPVISIESHPVKWLTIVSTAHCFSTVIFYSSKYSASMTVSILWF